MIPGVRQFPPCRTAAPSRRSRSRHHQVSQKVPPPHIILACEFRLRFWGLEHRTGSCRVSGRWLADEQPGILKAYFLSYAIDDQSWARRFESLGGSGDRVGIDSVEWETCRWVAWNCVAQARGLWKAVLRAVAGTRPAPHRVRREYAMIRKWSEDPAEIRARLQAADRRRSAFLPIVCYSMLQTLRRQQWDESEDAQSKVENSLRAHV